MRFLLQEFAAQLLAWHFTGRFSISAVLLYLAFSSELFCDNCEKLYCETYYCDAYAFKYSEQISDNTELMRFYWVQALDDHKMKFAYSYSLTLCALLFEMFEFFVK